MINMRVSALISGAAFMLSLVIGLFCGAGIFALARAAILGAVFFLITGGAYWLIVNFLPELLSPSPAQPAPEAGEEPGARVDISLEEEGLDEAPDSLQERLGEGLAAFSPEEYVSGMDQIDTIGYTHRGGPDDGPSAQGFSREDPGGASAGEPAEFLAAEPARGSAGEPARALAAEPVGFLAAEPAGGSAAEPAEFSAGEAAHDKPAVLEDMFESVDELPDIAALASSFSSADESGDGETDRVLPLDVSQRKGGSGPGGGKLEHDYSTHDMASALRTILKRD
ncbi:MAG: hypothetical protein LBU28_00250 [Spirochaetaceae bacterium]|jgi:hypothetical protein|nr:hypothetical protein [Spirochaetaceae bacterium]